MFCLSVRGVAKKAFAVNLSKITNDMKADLWIGFFYALNIIFSAEVSAPLDGRRLFPLTGLDCRKTKQTKEREKLCVFSVGFPQVFRLERRIYQKWSVNFHFPWLISESTFIGTWE